MVVVERSMAPILMLEKTRDPLTLVAFHRCRSMVHRKSTSISLTSLVHLVESPLSMLLVSQLKDKSPKWMLEVALMSHLKVSLSIMHPSRASKRPWLTRTDFAKRRSPLKPRPPKFNQKKTSSLLRKKLRKSTREESSKFFTLISLSHRLMI